MSGASAQPLSRLVLSVFLAMLMTVPVASVFTGDSHDGDGAPSAYSTPDASSIPGTGSTPRPVDGAGAERFIQISFQFFKIPGS